MYNDTYQAGQTDRHRQTDEQTADLQKETEALQAQLGTSQNSVTQLQGSPFEAGELGQHDGYIVGSWQVDHLYNLGQFLGCLCSCIGTHALPAHDLDMFSLAYS